MKRNVALVGATVGSLTLGAVLAGCKVGPNYVPPNANVPLRYAENPATTQSTTRAAAQPATVVDIEQWWQSFRDPQLDALILRATRGNLDLRAAEARLRQARAEYGITYAGLFPIVDGTASYRRSRGAGGTSGSFTSTGTGSGGTTGTGTTGTGTSGTGTTGTGSSGVFSTGSKSERDLYSYGFDSSWEIDVWGKVRREIEAARYDIQAAVENRRNVLVTLTAEVATTYVQYRGYQRQLQIAYDNIKAQRDTLGVTRRQFEAGLKNATELDVRRAEALVFTTESQVPALEQNLKQAAHKLAILLGENPDFLLEELGNSKPIPNAEVPEVPVGLPSDLLRRRPDIRAAERNLAAATANIGVAVADLFPRFSLTGSFGISATKFKELGNYSQRSWAIGPAVTIPVLDWGRIRSNIEVQNALQEQAFVAYQSTVLTSLREVEDAIVAYTREQVRRQSLADAVDANRAAVGLATQRYNAGLTTFIDVLDAERSLYLAQDQLVQSEQLVSTNLVAVYKALGGGWKVLEQNQPPANVARVEAEAAPAQR